MGLYTKFYPLKNKCHLSVSDRNPTNLRNEKGNQYCMNCQQTVFAKTKFSILEYVGFCLAVILSLSLIIGGSTLFSVGFIIGTISYIFYWYFYKSPVCPVCKSKHFERVTDSNRTVSKKSEQSSENGNNTSSLDTKMRVSAETIDQKSDEISTTNITVETDDVSHAKSEFTQYCEDRDLVLSSNINVEIID